MGELLVIYSILGILALGAQILLYKNKSKNSIFILNMLLAIVIAYIAYTSQAENFLLEKNIALGIGSISILALILKLFKEKYSFISKILLTISILGGFILLFI